ncbi:MAG: hypothetical protein J7639_24785 [Paenibacillaceae bacterium]|nr:hypothetical protein [Paenibacillaceae bacterium]
MNKQDIVDRLLDLPAEIGQAEDSVIWANQVVVSAKAALQEAEDRLLTSNVIDGKNEAIRSAQLRSFTGPERESLLQAENDSIKCRSALTQLQNEFRALQAVADLLKGAA